MPDPKDRDKLVYPVNTDAVKQYFVKMEKLDKSQTWKGGLGKKSVSMDWKPERTVHAKIRDIKIEKTIILIDWNPKGRSMQKLRIMTK